MMNMTEKFEQSQKYKKHNKTKYRTESDSEDDLRVDNREDQTRDKCSEDIINKLTNRSYNNPKQLKKIKKGSKWSTYLLNPDEIIDQYIITK